MNSTNRVFHIVAPWRKPGDLVRLVLGAAVVFSPMISSGAQAGAGISPGSSNSTVPTLSAAPASPELSATTINLLAGTAPPFTPARILLRPGEKLWYTLSVNDVHVGRCVMEICDKRRPLGNEEGPALFELRASLRTSRMGEFIRASIRADILSQVDTEKGFSRLYTLESREYRRTRRERIDYEIKNGVAYYRFGEPPRDPETKRWGLELEIGDPDSPSTGASDPLSAVYYLRAFDWKSLSTTVIPVVSDRTVWPAVIEVKNRGQREVVGVGTRETVEVEVRSYCEGPVSRKGRPRAIIDAATGVIIEFRMDVPAGSGRALLTRSENSPLTISHH